MPTSTAGSPIVREARVERLIIGLTRREREVLALVCAGLSNKKIARRLKISDGTVKVRLHKIYEKLATRNRTLLALMAKGEGKAKGLHSRGMQRPRGRA